MSDPYLLQARNLKKKYLQPLPIDLWQGVSITLSPKESIAIMGTSGVGKSTLLHILGTLEIPTEGDLFILGKEVQEGTSHALRNKHIGFIFQNFHLLEDFTVLSNVLMPAFIAHQDIQKGSLAFERALFLLEKVGMLHRLNFPTKVLSGGEKQRVAIARALINDPAILLADEPSGSLDENTSDKIHELLLECVHTFHKGLILVTHNPKLSALCSKTLVLQKGELING